MQEVRIFKNPAYGQELERLLEDPIVIELAAGLPYGLGNTELGSWDFIAGAAREYHRRGGRQELSIGGPGEAVKRVYAQLERVRKLGPCRWYALCENMSAGTVAHPILGAVPTCQRCADKHELELEAPAGN